MLVDNELVATSFNSKDFNSILDALLYITQRDADFTGDNGSEYLWSEAEGYSSNLDYLVTKVENLAKEVKEDYKQVVDLFLSKFFEHNFYYMQPQWEMVETAETNGIVCLAVSWIEEH